MPNVKRVINMDRGFCAPFSSFPPKLTIQKNCNDCGEEIGINFKIYNNRKYCEDCYLNVIETCALCFKKEKNEKEFFPARLEENDMRLVMVCTECTSKLQICEYSPCETYFKKDVNRKCDQCDRQLCKLHIIDHQCRGTEPTGFFREVSNAHYIGSPELAKEIKIPWLVGVELEAVNGDPNVLFDKLDSRIGLGHDGSLNGTSPIEMQLPPSSNEKLEKFIKHTTKISRNSGYRINKSCGVHIHLNALDLRNDSHYIFKLLSAYYAIEPVIFAMLPKSRRENKYALPLRCWIGEAKMLELTRKPIPTIDELQMMWYKSRSLEQAHMFRNGKYDTSRYHGFNLHTFFTRGTIELRHHHGTLNKTKITNWINLHLMIFDWVKTKYDQNVVDAVFFCENPADKFRLMCRHMKFPKIIRRYVMRNMRKFANNDNEDKD